MKWGLRIKMGCLCGVMLALATVASARRNEVTLVLVPRSAPAIRYVGLDLAQRFPVLLVGYQVGPDGALSLHGWTGKEWVNILPENYVKGAFFKTPPQSALIVEKEGEPVPLSLVPSEAWCPEVYKVATTQVRPVLHLVGAHYDFKFKEWEWFAERYRLPIDAINPEGINVAWYHRRLDEHLKTKEPVGRDDLKYWIAVRHKVPETEPAKPVESEPGRSGATPDNAVNGAQQEEAGAAEGAIDEDPFSGEVQPAVVMGAGDVPAEGAEVDPEADEAL